MQQHPALGLLVLVLVCFLSATLLPFPSELSLIAYLKAFPQYKILGILSASFANTAGGVVSYVLGYILKNQIVKYKKKKNPIYKEQSKIKRLAYVYIRKYGSICLLLSWLPILGDILCLSAGFLKINIYFSMLYMFIGKLIRYIVIAYII